MSPWQGAAQATRCLCLAVEALQGCNSPHWGQGGGQAGGWKEAWPPWSCLPLLVLGLERNRPQSLETLANDFPRGAIKSYFFMLLGISPGLLKLARWEIVPGAGLLYGILKDPVSPVWDEEPLLSLAGNRND